jgi:3-keto-5-aminohexanoate cleavage enzyme
MANADKVVITCAVSGVLANRKQCPGIPYTPKEIALECKRAYDAGAAVVHIHARNDDGSPTFETGTFAAIKEETRKLCPIILNFSTGTILDDVSQQAAYLREVKPEIGALNMGTMNYAKYSANKKQFAFDMIFPNTVLEDPQAPRGDERGGHQAGARVLRQRSHRRHRAAARHGRAQGRPTSSRSS